MLKTIAAVIYAIGVIVVLAVMLWPAKDGSNVEIDLTYDFLSVLLMAALWPIMLVLCVFVIITMMQESSENNNRKKDE